MAISSMIFETAPPDRSQKSAPKAIGQTWSGYQRGTIRYSAQQAIKSHAFEYSMGLVIVFNSVVLVIETDQTADGGDAAAWIHVGGWAILGTFIFELLLRLFALGRSFWQDVWNVIDFSIVVVDTSLSLLGILIGSFFPVSMLRIFRLGKMMRMSKLFRLFPELRVFARSLAGSARVIGWGLVMVFVILLLWSLLAVVFIHPLAKDLNLDEECPRCSRAYATVFSSMLTMWQSLVVGDGWGPGPTLIIETYPATVFFFMPMFGMVGMAVMNLILGVVVDVSMTAKCHIDQEDDKERKIKFMRTKVDLLDLMEGLDENGDGFVSKDEAFEGFKKPGDFRDSVLAAGITEEDFEMIWTIVDVDKKGRLPYKEFIDRLYAIRTSETDFMLAYIKFYITLIRDDLLKAIRSVEGKVDVEAQELAEIHKLEASLEKGVEAIGAAEMLKIEVSPAGAIMTEPRGVLDKQQALESQKVKHEIQDDPFSKPSQTWISSQRVLEQCILNLQTELQKARDMQTELHQFNGLKVENALQDIQGELKRSHDSQMELKEICAGFGMESALQHVLDMRSEVKLSFDGIEAKQNGLLIALKGLTKSHHRESDGSREPSRGSPSMFVQPLPL